MFKELLDHVRQRRPLIHNITNYVTVNDCANIILACGGSPIMSDDIEEVEEITTICNGLNINIGTLNQRTIPAMFAAGKRANELGHPIVLDPVGVGASTLRTNTALQLIDNIHFSVIRGNISELKALALGSHSTKGVDAHIGDQVKEVNLDEAIQFAKQFAQKTQAIIAITGAIDIVANAQTAYCIFNGHPMMSCITGTGCQLSALTATFIAANPNSLFQATAAAVCTMGICGEIAYKRLNPNDGNATYRNFIIDAVYHINDDLDRYAKFKIL